MSSPPKCGTQTAPNADQSTNGFSPTAIVAPTAPAVGSITLIVLLPRFGIQTVPSGATAPSPGIGPTRITWVTRFERGSIRATVREPMSVTHIASADGAKNDGPFCPTETFVTRFERGSIRN